MDSTYQNDVVDTVRVVAVVLAVVIAGAASAGVVAAQENPGQPVNFYGAAADEAGTPAPVGAEIYALIDGEVEDSIVVEERGQYGGEGSFDDKLTVNDGAGDEVVFRLNGPDGPQALESPYDLSNADGGAVELDLTFPESTFEGAEPAASFDVSIDEGASTLDADAGGTLSVAATIENLGDGEGTQDIVASVDGAAVGTESGLTLAGGVSETVTFEFDADAAYDGQDVEVASENDSDTATLTVTQSGTSPTETPGDGTTPTETATPTAAPNGGNGGGGGGGQGGGSDGGSAEAIATGTGATVNFRDVAGGQQLSVDVPNVEGDGAAVAVLDLTSTFANEDFRVEFTPPQQDPPSDTPSLGQEQGSAVSYFTAEGVGIDDDSITAVGFTFTLSPSEIPEDRSVDDVRLFRHHDGEWVTLETTHLGDDRFRATASGFTSYAIGFQNAETESDLSVTEVSLDPETITPGNSTTVSATVENAGEGSGSTTLELTVDGDTLTTRDVTVAAGGSQTVTFEQGFDAAGTYEVVVNGVSGGTLTVEEAATSEQPSTEPGTTSETIPGFGVVGSIVALVIGLLAATRRR